MTWKVRSRPAPAASNLKTAGFSDQEIDAYLARAPKSVAAAR
jgi:hypothetical protein